MFVHSVTSYGISSVTHLRIIDNNMVRQCLQHLTKNIDNQFICNTCALYLKKGKCPPSAIYNKMSFPKKPQALHDLHDLEWRLISPRLAFMKIHAAPRGGQKKIMGNVVNIPADIVTTVKSLPRMTEENATIQVDLKRHLKYKHAIMSENVRPEKLRQAASYLVQNSPLFKEYGIQYNSSWTPQDTGMYKHIDPCFIEYFLSPRLILYLLFH